MFIFLSRATLLLLVLLTGCEMSSVGSQMQKKRAVDLAKCTEECAGFGMEADITASKQNGVCRCKSVSDSVV